MKAIDPCERWMLQDPLLIIDRLLARSQPRPAAPDQASASPSSSSKDRYHRQARKAAAILRARAELARRAS